MPSNRKEQILYCVVQFSRRIQHLPHHRFLFAYLCPVVFGIHESERGFDLFKQVWLLLRHNFLPAIERVFRYDYQRVSPDSAFNHSCGTCVTFSLPGGLCTGLPIVR